jgi:hypothetical protein
MDDIGFFSLETETTSAKYHTGREGSGDFFLGSGRFPRITANLDSV